METKKQQLNSSLKQDSRFNRFCALSAKFGSVVLPAIYFALFSPNVCFAAGSQQTIHQLQQQIIDNPRDVDAHLKLAIQYSISNNFVKAVETYFALLRIDPDNFHAYNNLGILYKQSGQYRDSLHCYLQAQRIDPDSYWVPYNMGLCYEAMGRMQEARESYGSALSLNPSFSQALQRLRILSDGGEGVVPELPGLSEAQIYVADSKQGNPNVISNREEAPVVVSAPAKKQKKAEAKSDTVIADNSPKISERIQKEKNKQKTTKTNYRTSRGGPAAVIFNQAMDALDGGKLEKAIELYVTAVVAERDLLSEPENGLIRQGLTYLKDRPNRMPNGLFFRGLMIYISGHLELAVSDLKNFVAANENNDKAASIGQYLEEANRILARYEAEKEAMAALQAERAAAAAAAAAAANAANTGVATSSDILMLEEEARPSDYVLKRMDTEQIIQEADRLSRESRLTDAVAVLEAGISKDPDNVTLLSKSANAYADMLLLKGDNEAGKMALSRFHKVYSKAAPNSREWAVAKDMIDELTKRVK